MESGVRVPLGEGVETPASEESRGDLEEDEYLVRRPPE